VRQILFGLVGVVGGLDAQQQAEPADELLNAVRAVSDGKRYLSSGVDKGVLAKLDGAQVDRYEQLTRREKQVFQLIVEGKTSPQISDELSITPKTVDAHRNNLMRKLDIHKQTELVKFAVRRGIIDL